MKVIVVGDIHIANRKLHNLEGDPLFRLSQFPRVATRLAEYVKENNIREVWIVGDIVDQAILQPEEAHVVSEFITTILATGVCIKYILGNHDVSSKSETLDSSDRSLVPLLIDYPNVHYMHRKIEEIEGVTFAWSNWQPNFSEVDWFDHADVFLSHVNILEGRFGQKLDESRFDFGLCGDIHMKCHRGKTHSTGAVIQSNAGDSPDGSFVEMEIKDGSYTWKYVDTTVPGIHEFLRVYRSDKMPEDYVEGMYDVITDVSKPEATKDLTDDQVEALFDSEATLTEALEAESSVVAKLIDSCMRSVEKTDLDLNTLCLERLEITNFRCIGHRVIDISDFDKLNRINGPVGKGKSSIVRALDYVFAGKGSPKALLKYGSKEMSVQVDYKYRGIQHQVTKSGQYVSKWIREGREMEAGSKKELQELFLADNPWIAGWRLMYHDQHSAGFLINMNVNDRVSFMSKLLGFDGIIETNKILTEKLKEAKKEMQARVSKADQAKAVVESKMSEIDQPKEELESLIAANEEAVKALKITLQELVDQRTVISNKIERSNQLDKAQGQLDSAMGKLNSSDKPSEVVFDNEAAMALFSKFNALKTSSDLDKIKARGLAIKAEMASPPDTCSECGGSLEVAEEWTKSRQAALDSAYEQYAEAATEVKLRSSMEDEISAQRVLMESSKSEQAKAVAYAKAEQAVEEAKSFVAEYEDAQDKEVLGLELDGISLKGKSIQEDIEKAQREISWGQERMKIFSQLDSMEEALDSACVAVDEFSNEVATIEEAVNATSMDGPVLSKTLAAAAHVLSDGVITVKTTKVSAKKVVPDFNVELTTEHGPIPYDQLSGGQLAAVDIYLSSRLAKLIGGMDILILDETLKFLNQEMCITLLDELKTCDIDKVVMIVHGKDTPQVTKVIEA